MEAKLNRGLAYFEAALCGLAIGTGQYKLAVCIALLAMVFALLALAESLK
jgi:hypothetical protein